MSSFTDVETYFVELEERLILNLGTEDKIDSMLASVSAKSRKFDNTCSLANANRNVDRANLRTALFDRRIIDKDIDMTSCWFIAIVENHRKILHAVGLGEIEILIAHN